VRSVRVVSVRNLRVLRNPKSYHEEALRLAKLDEPRFATKYRFLTLAHLVAVIIRWVLDLNMDVILE
jgi:hypothetical protein